MATDNVYDREFQVIFRAVEANVRLFDATIKKIEDFVGSTAQLFDALSAVPAELPTKVPKRGFFESAFSRKRKPPVEFESFEPGFSLVWKDNISACFLAQPGASAFLENVKSDFLSKLRQVRDLYASKGADLKNYVEEKTREMRASQDLYEEKDSLYQQQCSKIEDTRVKIEAETAAGKTPEQILRLRQILADAQTEFPEKQKAAVEAFAQMTQKKADYSVDMERALMVFEELNSIREKNVTDLVQSLVQPLLKLAGSKQAAGESLNANLDSVSIESDLEPLEKLVIEEREWPELEFEGVRMDFELSEFLPPEQIFEYELKLFGAEAVESYDPKKDGEISLEAGDIVTVIEKGKSSWKVVNETKHLTGYVPSGKLRAVPEMARRLFKVKSNHKTETFEVFEGEYVISIRETDDKTSVFCQNAYGGRGTLPVEILEPQ